MPFGKYKATFNKREKETVRPLDVIPPPEIKRPDRKNPRAESSVPPVPEFRRPGASSCISIIVAGRSAEDAVDFLAGLYKTVNPTLSSKGLSFYSDDSQSISELLAKQQEISNMLIGGFSGEYCPGMGASAAAAENKTFSMKLCRSGSQSLGIQLDLICASWRTAASLCTCDGVLLLTGAQMYEDESVNSYASAASAVLSSAKNSEIPAAIVLCQFEKYGKIRNRNNLCSVEQDVYLKLSRSIRSSLGASSSNVPVIPAQIYGGLAYTGTNDSGVPVFSENRFGGLISYKPEGCCVPLLYLIEKISNDGRLTDIDLINGIKEINRIQRAEFTNCGISLEG